jgi:hypothetical protein
MAAQRIPVSTDGHIDAEEADAAWAERTDASRRPLRSPRSRGHHSPGALILAKTAESLERGRQLKLQNDQLEGRLVDAGATERLWGAIVVSARNQLQGLPSRARLALNLDMDQTREQAGLVEQVLHELADGRKYGGDDDDAGDGHGHDMESMKLWAPPARTARGRAAAVQRARGPSSWWRASEWRGPAPEPTKRE